MVIKAKVLQIFIGKGEPNRPSEDPDVEFFGDSAKGFSRLATLIKDGLEIVSSEKVEVVGGFDVIYILRQDKPDVGFGDDQLSSEGQKAIQGG